uniref:Uncharacterized protein n=1 Tax=Rhodosorus marinus TaxID=101924 RepID=A0A7S3EKU1_9RHOD
MTRSVSLLQRIERKAKTKMQLLISKNVYSEKVLPKIHSPSTTPYDTTTSCRSCQGRTHPNKTRNRHSTETPPPKKLILLLTQLVPSYDQIRIPSSTNRKEGKNKDAAIDQQKRLL